jgi:hypothetical protein
MFSQQLRTATLILSIVSPLAHANECASDMTALLKSVALHANAEQLGQLRVKLLKSQQFWQNWGPKMSHIEYLRAKTVRELGSSLVFDRPFIAVETLTPITTDMQLAYLSATKKIEVLKVLGEENPSLRQQLEHEINASVEILATNIDEFEAGDAFLDAVIKNDADPRQGAAKTVKDYLSVQRLNGAYLREQGLDPASIATPTRKQMKELIELFPRADIARLRRNRNREMQSALLGITPTQSLYSLLDSWVSRIPGVNKTRLRRFLRAAEDESASFLYSPDIERVASTAASLEKQLHMLEVLNAQTDDAFINTFARRIDLRDNWLALLEGASTRADKTLHSKLEAAMLQARSLGDLAPNSSGTTSRLLFRGLDLAVVSGAGYLGLRYGWPTADGSDDESVAELERVARAATEDTDGATAPSLAE